MRRMSPPKGTPLTAKINTAASSFIVYIVGYVEGYISGYMVVRISWDFHMLVNRKCHILKCEVCAVVGEIL